MLDNLHATSSGNLTNHPVWKRSTSFNAWEMYLNGTPGEAASEYAAPSRAKSLKGLPPTYISVGSEDLFRDEDISFGKKLIEDGVPCEMSVQGCANLDFIIHNSLPLFCRGNHYIPDASGPKNIQSDRTDKPL